MPPLDELLRDYLKEIETRCRDLLIEMGEGRSLLGSWIGHLCDDRSSSSAVLTPYRFHIWRVTQHRQNQAVWVDQVVPNTNFMVSLRWETHV